MTSIFDIATTKVSTEAITRQTDGTVHLLEEEFRLIRGIMLKKVINGETVFKEKDCKIALDNINSLIFKKTGIKIKHIYKEGVPYSVLPIVPNNFNVLTTKHTKHYERITKILEEFKNNEVKDIDRVTSYKKDLLSIYKSWHKSMDKLNDKLHESGITIVESEGRIVGLPKDLVVPLILDFNILVHEANLTPKEMVFVLLHEIGHAFKHISESIRTVSNTVVLLDSLRESLEIREYGYVKSLNITYKNLYDKNSKDTTSVVPATIRVIDGYIKSNYKMSRYNTYSFTDSEQLADQFATRFGGGPELVNALYKLGKYNYKKETVAVASLVSTYTTIVTLGTVLTYGMVLGGIGVAALGVLSGVIVGYIVDTIDSILTAGKQIEGRTYDYNKRRYRRIRNDIVRMLRNGMYKKDEMNIVFTQLDAIDKFIENATDEEDKITLATKIVRLILPSAKKFSDAKELDILTEDLTENELHVVSNKLLNRR